MKEIVQLHDKKFKVSISAETIDEAVKKVAQRISNDYKDGEMPLFVGVLNGSFIFMADLVRKLDFNAEISFVKLSSYEGAQTTGEVKTLIGLNNHLKGRHVIIVEDIVDTGVSIENMINQLKTYEPQTIEVCTLFFKPAAYQKTYKIKYSAMEIGNDFIVGYGLDYDQLGRNFKDIYTVIPE